jgi:uncharacterized RDD family membrane protein YckC
MAWATIVFIGLLGPFAALFALTVWHPLPRGAAATQAAGGPVMAAAAGGSAPDPRGGGRTASAGQAPLFAAGDGHSVWVVRPLAVGEKKIAAFEVLVRANNAGVWSALRPENASYFETWPTAFAVIPSAGHDSAGTTAYLFGPNNRLTALTAERVLTAASLPADHRLLAATGSEVGVFALTAGPVHASTTRPGDRLRLNRRADGGALPWRPSAAPAPATVPAASIPATTAAAIEPVEAVNAYWYPGMDWVALPPLGAPGSSDAPAAGSAVTAVHVPGRLLAAWVNPERPGELVVRAHADDDPRASWSAAVRSTLAEPLPEKARLLSVAIGQSAFIFYPAPAGKSFSLVGGRVLSTPGAPGDLTLSSARIAPMFLGSAGEGVHPDADIAVAASENAVVAVTVGPNGVLRSAVFSTQGEPLSPPRQVVITTGNRDIQVGQNVALLLVVLLMALSLWRWRRDPRSPRLPVGMRTASLPTRGLAFLIDMAIPFVAVCTAMGLWEDRAFLAILDTWQAALTKPDELLASKPLLYVLGLYTLHVSVGELFFRRSIGKALTGIQVLMIDGHAPTVAAVLVRNLVRLAEIVPAGILIVYLFISDYRQRLGDLLAHTIVVAPRSPDEKDDEEGEREEQEEREEEPAGRR